MTAARISAKSNENMDVYNFPGSCYYFRKFPEILDFRKVYSPKHKLLCTNSSLCIVHLKWFCTWSVSPLLMSTAPVWVVSSTGGTSDDATQPTRTSNAVTCIYFLRMFLRGGSKARRSGSWEHAMLSAHPPFPQIDIIRTMVIVWRVRGKTIRSVLCNTVCNNCAECNAHTYEPT